VLVAESGIHTAADARRMREAGADAILVGESLMRADDAAARIKELGAA
jgi:indole-3-glycerol phosphate synthase